MNNVKATDAKIIKGPHLDYTPDPRGVGYIFFTQMKKHKDKIAQIDVLTGERDSFSSLLQRCIRTAIAMRSRGVKRDDIISICSLNHLNSIVPFVAGLFIGAKIASLHPSQSPSDMKHLMQQVTPKIIFVAPKSVEVVTEVLREVSPTTEIVVFGDTKEYTGSSEFLRPSVEENSFEPLEAKNVRDTAVIYFSSGTSGLAKGICINHYTLLYQAVNFINFGVCCDIILGFAPLYWTTSVTLWSASLIKGTIKLLIPEFDTKLAWETIGAYKPTFMFLAPNQMLSMLDVRKSFNVDTSSIRDINVGGAVVLEQQMSHARSAFPTSKVSIVFGQTEMCCYITCFRPCDPEDVALIDKKPTSSGRPIPGMAIKVVDLETDEILEPTQKGELRLKAEFQLNGYHNQDSTGVWDADGWFRTGDIGYYDEDRCFYIVERAKELLKFRSWHVPPAIIENVLLTHPMVEKAVVVGTPHKVDVDHPTAVVILKKSTKTVTPEEIEKYVEERVEDRYRLRGGVRFVERFPVTPTGKVKRNIIKQMILEELL